MKLVVSSHIQGTFLGYAPGVVHKLDDGSEWEQTGGTKGYVYSEGLGCRVLWIDVEGTSGVASLFLSPPSGGQGLPTCVRSSASK